MSEQATKFIELCKKIINLELEAAALRAEGHRMWYEDLDENDSTLCYDICGKVGI